jgi:hypothetical protein
VQLIRNYIIGKIRQADLTDKVHLNAQGAKKFADGIVTEYNTIHGKKFHNDTKK